MTATKSNWWVLEVCDRCPTARPQSVFILKSGRVLYMCGHCSNTHREAIAQYLDTEVHAPVLESAAGSSTGPVT